jgi:hypothetical protein
MNTSISAPNSSSQSWPSLASSGQPFKPSSKESGLATTFMKQLLSWALPTSASTKNLKKDNSMPARTVREQLYSLHEPSLTDGSNPPRPVQIFVRLKPKLWYGQFGAEEIPFELHIRDKALEVVPGSIKQSEVEKEEGVLRVKDETGEEWTVFFSWISFISRINPNPRAI